MTLLYYLLAIFKFLKAYPLSGPINGWGWGGGVGGCSGIVVEYMTLLREVSGLLHTSVV